MLREIHMLGAGIAAMAITADHIPTMVEQREIGEKKHRHMGKPLPSIKLERKEKSPSLRKMLNRKGRK